MKAKRVALKISLLYCLIGGFWIIASDRVLASLVSDANLLTILQTYKGLVFIVLSVLALYFVLSRIFEKSELTTLERIHAEQTVRESRDRLKRILDSLFTFVGVLTLDGVLLEANRAPFEAAGIKREDAIGKLFHETYWWAHSAETQRSLGECLKRAAQGETVRRDFEVRVANNRLITIDFIVSPLRNAGNQITELVASAVDITDRKRVEDELRETSERFHQLADNITDVFWMRTPDFNRVIYISPGFEKVWGRPMEELYSNPQKWIDFIFPEDRARVVSAFDELRKGGLRLDIEYRIVWPNGEVRWIRARGFEVCDTSGRVARYAGVITDITARKQAEASLRKSEAQLRAMFEDAAIGIALVDTEGRPVRCNSALCRMLGYSKEELSQMTFPQFTHAEDIDEDLKLFGALVAGERDHYEITKRFIRKDGQIVFGRLAVSLIQHEKGLPTLAVGMVEDITESRMLEEQMRQSQKMEAIGKLAGGVAHDFNNILAVIQMQAGLLMYCKEIPVKQRDFAGEIIRAAERAANLTRQLLLFGRRQTVQASEHDLNEIVTNIAKMLQRMLGEDIEMELKWAAERLWIRADAGMIDQILMNLAVNARDSMPNGGRLAIETSSVAFGESSAARRQEGRRGLFACLKISDSGSGISAENLPHIFEPFFTTKEVGKGTGLGLATVFGIVQQHQGWINVESEVGRGTTFRIYFPRIEKPSSPAGNQTTLPSMRPGNETILLVEDDFAVSISVEYTLNHLGYRVLTAADGKEAVEVWKQHRHEIRLLLTDLVMPRGMNGKELAVKLLVEKPELKVIYSSGYTRDLVSADFKLQDGVNFLPKPYSLQKLSETVRRNLDSV
ncbi:MAG TPA: PAS domain S-box protein [Candidatus Polarisedimenticolia bacterium]|nr:PAS domain S-box protein [Candidatus Polarisedimenticolia bacterium]